MNKAKEYFMYIIGLLVIAGAFSLTLLLQYHSVPPENRDVLNQAYGSIWTMCVMVVTWCFGSSKGSESKDVLLANSTPKPDPTSSTTNSTLNTTTVTETKKDPESV